MPKKLATAPIVLPPAAMYYKVNNELAGNNALDGENEQAKKLNAERPSMYESFTSMLPSVNVMAAYLDNAPDRYAADMPADPTWTADKYWEQAKDLETGLQDHQIQEMRDSARSLAQAQAMRRNFEEENYQAARAAEYGTGFALAGGLVGGLIDPTSYAVGLGAFKAVRAWTTLQGAARATAEGAVAGAGYTAALAAAGNHMTLHDYSMNTLLGAGLGGLFHVSFAGKAAREQQGPQPKPEMESVASKEEVLAEHPEKVFALPAPEEQVRTPASSEFIPGNTAPELTMSDKPAFSGAAGGTLETLDQAGSKVSEAGVFYDQPGTVTDLPRLPAPTPEQLMESELIKPTLNDELNVAPEQAPDYSEVSSTDSSNAALDTHVEEYIAAVEQAAKDSDGTPEGLVDKLKEQDVKTIETSLSPDIGASTVRGQLDDTDVLWSELRALADRAGVRVELSDRGFKTSTDGTMVVVPDKASTSVDIKLASETATPAQVFAHELGHALMFKKGISFKGIPIARVKQVIGNYPRLVEVSRKLRDRLHNSNNPEIKRYANTNNEILADAISSVLLGIESPEILADFFKATGMRVEDLHLPSPKVKVKVEDTLLPTSKREHLPGEGKDPRTGASWVYTKVQPYLLAVKFGDTVLDALAQLGFLKYGKTNSVNFEGGIAKSITIEQGLPKATAEFIAHEEVAHLRIADYFKEFPDYKEFIEWAGRSKAIREMVNYRSLFHNDYRKDYAEQLQELHGKNADSLAELRATEEAVVHYWTYLKNPSRYKDAMLDLYSTLPPVTEGAKTLVEKLMTSLRNWGSKLTGGWIKPETPFDEFVTQMGKLMNARNAVDLVAAAVHGEVRATVPGSTSTFSKRPNGRGEAAGKMLDRQREVFDRLKARAYKEAAAFMADNPFDKKKIVDKFAAIPQMLSDAMLMANTKNLPIQQDLAMVAETTTGFAGRKPTAAIVKERYRNRWMSRFVRPYHNEYTLWMQGQGRKVLWDMLTGSSGMRDFNREVFIEIQLRERRILMNQKPKDPAVVRAADVVEALKNDMRESQIEMKVEGWKALPENSRGYIARQMNPRWFANATDAQIEALRDAFAAEFRHAWGEQYYKIADAVAYAYVERGRNMAYEQPSLSLVAAKNKELIESIMEDWGITTPDQKEAMLRELNNYGSKHTKGRLPLDLLTTVTDKTGAQFMLMDAFNTDVQQLVISQIDRVSGDVGLASIGYQGESAINIRKQIITQSPDGQRATEAELAAWERMMSSMLGKPIGKRHAVLDGIRLATSANLLGGNVAVTLANFQILVNMAGMKLVFKQYMPRLHKLVIDLRGGKTISDDPIMQTIEPMMGMLGEQYDLYLPTLDPEFSAVQGSQEGHRILRILQTAGQLLGRVTGNRYVETSFIRGAGHLLGHLMLEAASKAKWDLSSGKPVIASVEGMAERRWKLLQDAVGTDFGGMDTLYRLSQHVDQIAKKDKDGNFISVDWGGSGDKELEGLVANAFLRGVRQWLQSGKHLVGTEPNYRNSSLGLFLTHFRGVPLEAMEMQVWRQWHVAGKSAYLGMLLSAMAFAIPIHLARVQLNSISYPEGKERDDYIAKQTSWFMLSRATMNYTLASGMASDMTNVLLWGAGNALEWADGEGNKSLGREIKDSAGMNVRTDVGGIIPGVSYLNKVVNAAGNLVGKGDVVGAVKALPMGTAITIAPLLNVAEQEYRESQK